MNHYDVIIRPLLSEKAYDIIPDKRYVFIVHPDANKTQIRQAVESIFDVQVARVNTVSNDGKVKRYGRFIGRTRAQKKAYVILKKDSKPIEFFEGMAE